MKLHHVAIRTADIMRSIEFYELLGFTVKERFTAGYTLACWLEGRGARLELMQIPQPKPAPDAFYDEHYVGYYHLSFDITDEEISLPIWLEKLGEKFKQTSVIPLKILLPPQQQMILDRIYEVAFIADIDNLPIEIIRRFD
ncbi:VOC family protein [Geminocystis sp. CENA526]|uniref:VOC family protein n=1 Tax=Geminocystis sp. CENA526 TaxID=1355871 RepID=UPI003D6DD87A